MTRSREGRRSCRKQDRKGRKLGVIAVLGTTQTLAWASSYYLPAILADRIAHDLGISSTWFFAAFSGALVISAMVGPRVDRPVDAMGGREVLDRRILTARFSRGHGGRDRHPYPVPKGLEQDRFRFLPNYRQSTFPESEGHGGRKRPCRLESL
jgi:hypothetical protein